MGRLNRETQLYCTYCKNRKKQNIWYTTIHAIRVKIYILFTSSSRKASIFYKTQLTHIKKNLKTVKRNQSTAMNRKQNYHLVTFDAKKTVLV